MHVLRVCMVFKKADPQGEPREVTQSLSVRGRANSLLERLGTTPSQLRALWRGLTEFGTHRKPWERSAHWLLRRQK